MAYAYVNHIYDQAPVTRPVKIAIISDLHLWLRTIREKVIVAGKINVEIIASLLEFLEVDAIVIAGDILNDLKDLESDPFCQELIAILRMIIGNIPTFYIRGNHDEMYKNEKGEWEEAESDLIQLSEDVFSQVSSSFHHLEDCKGILLNDFFEENIGQDVTIVGLNMPFKFYEGQKEDVRVFKEHFMNHFDKNLMETVLATKQSYKISVSHPAGKMAHLALKEKDSYFEKIIMTIIKNGHMFEAHTHNGFWSNRINPKGNFSLVSPQKKFFEAFQCGTIFIEEASGKKLPGITVLPAVNSRVEWGKLGDLYFGGPGMALLHLDPIVHDKPKCKSLKRSVYVNHDRYLSSQDWIEL